MLQNKIIFKIIELRKDFEKTENYPHIFLQIGSLYDLIL